MPSGVFPGMFLITHFHFSRKCLQWQVGVNCACESISMPGVQMVVKIFKIFFVTNFVSKLWCGFIQLFFFF